MRLHLGCGEKHWPGFVNVDAHGDPDVISDCRKLPFDADYADEIHSIHFVEHVPRLDLENMLVDWHRVLKPGGKLVIEVPCLDKMAQHIVNGEKNLRLTLLGIFGDPRDKKPGMLHAWAYTKAELSEAVLQCGFNKVEVMEPKFHLESRDMRLEAVKP
jgi:ubiquinone/menaquinone biosynthesis C-methylase UbiE